MDTFDPNAQPPTKEEALRFYKDHLKQCVELFEHTRALAEQNRLYVMALALTPQQVQKDFDMCLWKVRADALNKTLEQGDAA